MSVRDHLVAPDVSGDLARVEQVLIEQASSRLEMVREAAGYLIAAGGKRLRPTLTLLAARFGNGEDARVVPCAAAIELTHLASLYHDDVIDETSVRRGVATANERYGNSVAVLTGDFLFARASSLAAELGAYVSRRLADTIAELCEGQIMETEAARAGSSERYFEIIRRKTAALMATACHLGAWLAGADAPTVAALTTYGECLGMAFQLADDILDIDGDASESGKLPGTDLREGVLTLPALETLAGAVPGAQELRRALDARDFDGALGVLRSNGSVERARAAVTSWQTRAHAALGAVGDAPAREALEALVGFVGERSG
jgi:heptaprenyl diphosphate synthase